jgi:hypothetical protein
MHFFLNIKNNAYSVNLHKSFALCFPNLDTPNMYLN